MDRRTRRLPHVYFYAAFTAICLVALMQVSTINSSSHSLNSDVRNQGSASNRGLPIGASYQYENSPLLSKIQLFLQAPVNKVASRVFQDTTAGERTSVVILLSDQADLSAAYDMENQDERGWYVYNTLTQHAARTQAGLQDFLKSEGVSYQSFWAANMIVATADRSLVDKLAARADVARVDSNAPTRWVEDPV